LAGLNQDSAKWRRAVTSPSTLENGHENQFPISTFSPADYLAIVEPPPVRLYETFSGLAGLWQVEQAPYLAFIFQHSNPFIGLYQRVLYLDSDLPWIHEVPKLAADRLILSPLLVVARALRIRKKRPTHIVRQLP